MSSVNEMRKDLARQLVTRYTAEGKEALAHFSPGERQLLLSAKQLHLDEVSKRLARGEQPEVNLVLKRLLERDCREIGQVPMRPANRGMQSCKGEVMNEVTDPRPRPQAWKRLIARLDAAYQKDGRAALEAMQPMETLALWNEKVRDYKILGQWLERCPDDQASRQEQKELLREANDIGGWINAKQRGQELQQSQRSRDLDMER